MVLISALDFRAEYKLDDNNRNVTTKKMYSLIFITINSIIYICIYIIIIINSQLPSKDWSSLDGNWQSRSLATRIYIHIYAIYPTICHLSQGISPQYIDLWLQKLMQTTHKSESTFTGYGFTLEITKYADKYCTQYTIW